MSPHLQHVARLISALVLVCSYLRAVICDLPLQKQLRRRIDRTVRTIQKLAVASILPNYATE